MSERLLDVSVPLRDGMPCWPTSPGVSLRRHLAIADGDDANASELRTDLHCGTHVDAPLHFVDGGADLEATGLAPFVGPAYVAHVSEARRIGAADLDAAGVPADVERLLLRTANSGGWAERPFDPDFVALSLDGARWIAERGMRLVGIDYLSIQRFEDGPETHRELLGNGVCILEGLELDEAPQGPYELICLPIRLAGAEAAPARVLLRSTA
jgi:arylformamidase